MAADVVSNQGGRRERLGFLLVFILTAITTSSSVLIIFMPVGVGWWYWERGVIFTVFASNLILVAVTIILHSVFVKKPSPVVSAAPMLGLAFAETWCILHYVFSLFYGELLLSPVLVLLFGVMGLVYSWAFIVGRDDFALTRKWFSILPFTCALGLSVAALLRGLIYSFMDDSILGIPAAILLGVLAAVVLALFALRGRRPMTPAIGEALSRFLMISVIFTPIIVAILMLLPRLLIIAFLWGEAVFILQFAVASANMDWLVHQPWGRSAVRAALAEGFISLPIWMLLIVAVFPNFMIR
jgi:hypothetical protein